MIRQCAWCKKILGEKEPIEDKRITHTICEECCDKIDEEKSGNIMAEPPFCAWCGGTCHCGDYSDREEQEYCECDLQYTMEESDMNQCAYCGGIIR